PGDFAHRRIADLLMVNYGCHFALGGIIWLSSQDRLSSKMIGVSAVCVAGGAINVYSFCQPGQPWLAPVLVWLGSVALVICSMHWNEKVSSFLGARSRTNVRLIGLATYPLYLL